MTNTRKTSEPDRCTAKWVYQGCTWAKCCDVAGHDGWHWNGTVKWSDTTSGAVPPMRENAK